MSDGVRIELSGGVLAITLTRPERRNAITVAMYSALAEAIESAASNGDVRLITLAGEGQDFCAGNDLSDFLHSLPRDSDDIPVWRLLRALARNTVPAIAAVRGNAVGIGTTMLLHCDLVIVEDGARFSLPFVDLGLVPEAASTLLLPRLAGRRRAARQFLLGEPFDATEAMEMGIASHLAEKGTLDSRLAGMVATLLAKPAEALALTQRLLRTGDSDSLLERIEIENRHFSDRLQSDEVKAAIANFFDSKGS